MLRSTSGNIHPSVKQVTPFIGRELETAAIVQLLQNPDCRLLSLIGTGGMGKTRLALHAMDLVGNLFDHGCFWVDLQPVSSTSLIAQAIAAAVGVSISGDVLTQVSNYLQNRHMLLVLDNFEHLIDGATLLTPLLAASRHLKILVTSREALNLREEWVHHVGGLSYPPNQNLTAGDIDSYDAVALFSTFARRVNPAFTLDQELRDVMNICRRVEGMPLALEIAASWTRTLTCAEIAEEIQKGLDLFTTRMRNIPERHHSIRVIFDQTLAMLSAQEQAVFRRFAVFRGGFTREAAHSVAGASLPDLSALIEKSLLKHEKDGRYHLHELVRQYAEEKLNSISNEADTVGKRHCEYYMEFLHQWDDRLIGGGQQEGIAAIKADLDNLRAAWQWAIKHADVECLQNGATAFANYCQIQSQYQEAADIFEQATQALSREMPTEQVEHTLLLVKHYQSGFYMRLGRLAEAEQLLHECEAVYRRLGIPPVPGFATDPAFNLGILALVRGDYIAAMRYGEEAQHTSETYNHRNNRQLAYHLLAEAAIGLGEYQRAEQYAQQSYALVKEVDNHWFLAYTYNQLGTIARTFHDYQTARRYYEASYTIRAEFNDPEGMALALNFLGEIAIEQQAYTDAHAFFHQALTIYDKINDRGGIAKVLNGMSVAAMAAGDYRTAGQQLKQALEVVDAIQFVSFMLNVIASIGELLARTGLQEQASELLSLVAHHPSANHDTQRLAAQLLERFDLSLLPEEHSHELEKVTSSLLLAFPELPDVVEPVTQLPYTPKFRQSLIEPLTEREQEVLYYISHGMQNREIAEKLIVTVGTVKAHINHIYNKLDVTNRVQAIARARELNLLP